MFAFSREGKKRCQKTCLILMNTACYVKNEHTNVVSSGYCVTTIKISIDYYNV